MKKIIKILICAGFIFSLNSNTSGQPKQLAKKYTDEICGGPERSLFLEQKIISRNIDDKFCAPLFCDCGCTNDLNLLIIYRVNTSNNPEVLLMVENISNYKILEHQTDMYADIAIIAWKDPENHSLDVLMDTLIFNGEQYTKKTNHLTNIELEKKENFKQTEDFIKKNINTFSLSQNTNLNLNQQYDKTLISFKSGKKLEAAQTLQKAIGPKPWVIDNSNVAIFNDLGYFLQEAGQNQDAIDVLTEVIAKFPERIPAYLNLADAYAGIKNSNKAKENYKKYTELMTKAGKQGKIPKRVVELLKK